MNNTKKSSKTTTIVIVVVVILAIVIYFYWNGSIPSPGALLQADTVETPDTVGANVLNMLNQIRSLHIDTALFADPAYLTLHDFTVTVPRENVGRINAFAPIPGFTPKTSATTGGGH